MSFSTAQNPDDTIGAKRNDAPALQALLDAPGHVARIPSGEYHLSTPVSLPAGTTLIADEGARFHAHGIPFALLTESAPPCEQAISVSGGQWIGAGFRFSFVRDLRLNHVVFRDTPRPLLLDHVDGFSLDSLALTGEQGPVVLAGCCRHGQANGIDATTARHMDATLVFATDDGKLPRGPIENSTFRDVKPATACFRSSGSTIRNITLETRDGIHDESGIQATFVPGGHYDNIVVQGHAHTSEPHRRTGERFPTKVLLEQGDFLVTSPFGLRVHPVTGESASMHNGVDGALWDGRMLVETGICAWREGVVVLAEDGDGPAGTNVAIDHGNGLVSRYFHMETGSLRVSKGQKVHERELLGWMGRTGRSTGEHLHFQLERHGEPIDPMNALKEL